MITAGVEMDNDTHCFPLAREGDHLDDLGRLTCFLQILPTEVLGKLKKGSLGSYESKLFGPGVNVFKGSRVDCDRSVEQALQPRREGGINVVLFGRGVVDMFAIDLEFVGGIGGIVFLGLVPLTIWCVRVGLILLEVADEFGMDTDGGGDNARDVPGECSSLVGVGSGRVCYRLARTESTSEVFLGCLFHGESECESHREWEAFRSGSGGRCY